MKKHKLIKTLLFSAISSVIVMSYSSPSKSVIEFDLGETGKRPYMVLLKLYKADNSKTEIAVKPVVVGTKATLPFSRAEEDVLKELLPQIQHGVLTFTEEGERKKDEYLLYSDIIEAGTTFEQLMKYKYRPNKQRVGRVMEWWWYRDGQNPSDCPLQPSQ